MWFRRAISSLGFGGEKKQQIKTLLDLSLDVEPTEEPNIPPDYYLESLFLWKGEFT